MVNWRSKNGLPQRSGSTGAPLIKLAVSLRVSGGIWLRRSPDSAIKACQKVLSDRGCIGRQPNVLCPHMRHGWGDECKAAGFSFAGGFAVFENTNNRPCKPTTRPLDRLARSNHRRKFAGELLKVWLSH